MHRPLEDNRRSAVRQLTIQCMDTACLAISALFAHMLNLAVKTGYALRGSTKLLADVLALWLSFED